MSQATSRFSQLLSRMSDRERKLVGVAVLAFATVIVGGIIYFGSGYLSAREKRVESLRAQLAQIQALEATYKSAEKRKKDAARKLKSNPVALFSLLQNAAGDLGLTLNDLNERTSNMKDSEIKQVSVEVNLKQVSIDKLNAFLEKIEGVRSSGLVKVTKLKVKTRYDNAELLDVNMTVSTWKAT